MEKCLLRPIKVTEELKAVIQEKLKKRGLSSRAASVALCWNEGKVNAIVKGYVNSLTLEEANALVCYLPIHRTELNEEFWYRYDNETSKIARVYGYKVQKERKKMVETKKEEPAITLDAAKEDYKVEPFEKAEGNSSVIRRMPDVFAEGSITYVNAPKPEAESVTLVRLLTADLMNMLNNRKDGDVKIIRSYTDIIIRNLERIAAIV